MGRLLSECIFIKLYIFFFNFQLTFSFSQQNVEFTTSSEREHKQAELKSSNVKMISKLSERQTCIKDRLELLSKRILRYKTFHITKHILSQLEQFDEHALHTQVRDFITVKNLRPLQHKYESN